MVAVENKIDILAKDVTQVKEQIISQTVDIAEIKGRLAGAPTTLQWLGIIFAMIFTVMGLSFAIIRFGAAH